MTTTDIREMNTISNILAGGLEGDPQTLLGIPLEVALALAEARDQMGSLPGVIENLHLSFERFNTVSSALNRMIELADQASAETLGDEERNAFNDEFVTLAKIVAADAGRQYYAGPRLNLLNQGEAQSAAKIMRYMTPVISTMESELTEQKELISEVITETLSFLNVVIQCYPESEAVGRLSSLVDQVSRQSQYQPISTTAGLLH